MGKPDGPIKLEEGWAMMEVGMVRRSWGTAPSYLSCVHSY